MTDRTSTKYIVLDRLQSYDEEGATPPQGEMKGLLKTIERDGLNLTIVLESGELLELKVSSEGYGPAQKRVADWLKVIKSFLAVGAGTA